MHVGKYVALQTARTDTPCIHTDRRLEHWSCPSLKQTRSTVRLSAVVTTLADSQRGLRGMQTSGRSRDSRADIFSRSELELSPRLRSDMTGYIYHILGSYSLESSKAPDSLLVHVNPTRSYTSRSADIYHANSRGWRRPYFKH